MKILVTGANGQVGSELQVLAANYPNWTFFFTDSSDLDITDSNVVFSFFKDNTPDACINCAAYTAVDKAESDEDTAYQVNVIGSKHLAEACSVHQTQLVQISTDYVYHNDQNTPFKETDTTNPQSVYARTKLKGEQIAARILPTTIIIRTSWVYSSFGHNFVKTMRRLGEERDQLGIVFDQIGTPTYARHLADTILQMLAKIANDEIADVHARGIYHYSNEGVCSWYDFAKAIFELSNIECTTKPIESSAYPTPAKRPPFSVLNKDKIKTNFDIEIPYWKEGLKECLDLL